MTKKKNKTFEDSLAELQLISEKLEDDEVGIDESIKLYEKGIELSKLCYGLLNKAELKITELNEKLENEISGENE